MPDTLYVPGILRIKYFSTLDGSQCGGAPEAIISIQSGSTVYRHSPIPIVISDIPISEVYNEHVFGKQR